MTDWALVVVEALGCVVVPRVDRVDVVAVVDVVPGRERGKQRGKETSCVYLQRYSYLVCPVILAQTAECVNAGAVVKLPELC